MAIEFGVDDEVAKLARRVREFIDGVVIRPRHPRPGGDLRAGGPQPARPGRAAPGAGADPGSLLTAAVKTGDGWSISGRKHFITGAEGAAFAIVMARTGDDAATMFLVDTDNPGVSVTRVISTIDTTFSGGHAVVEFDDCRVSDDAVLGQPHEGFQYAQVRLGPARLTHCMRWLGLARARRLRRPAPGAVYGRGPAV